MTTQIRLAFRLQRFEILAAAFASAAFAVAALVVSARLGAVGLPPDCWAAVYGGSGAESARAAECAGPVQMFGEILQNEVGPVMAVMALLPLAVGIFVGAPTVGREIESGTASTVWALATSRSRWVLWRLLPVAAVVALLLVVMGATSELLWIARTPFGSPNRFDDPGLHGAVVVAKGLAAFGLAALMGAALGRVLPAVIVATPLCLVVVAGGLLIRGLWEGQITVDDAGQVLPTASQSMSTWLFDNSETVMFALVAAVSLVLIVPVVNRKRAS